MSTNSYPPLRLAVLNGLISLKDSMESDPEYLNASSYDQETKDILTKLLATKTVDRVVEKIVTVAAKTGRGRPSKDTQLGEEDEIKIQQEISKLLASIEAMETTENMEVSQKIALTKNKSALLENVLKMRERETTVRKTEEFKETVISILQDLVPEKDREIFMSRLEPFR